ncbi:hypothetical protein AVEN_104168-1 [Araneus ventricosus]|uniref:Uncharacterized protein n=1 Tax=Araneus ventricosus TaxID=182803 RepID=A0A4Y2QPE8_ARAVE|nr:hypothetical protein AVEN_104168-1 [Araneus ventricosus]
MRLQPGLATIPQQKLRIPAVGQRAGPSPLPSSTPLLFSGPKACLRNKTNKIPVIPTKGPLYAVSNPSLSFQERDTLSGGQAPTTTPDGKMNDPY